MPAKSNSQNSALRKNNKLLWTGNANITNEESKFMYFDTKNYSSFKCYTSSDSFIYGTKHDDDTIIFTGTSLLHNGFDFIPAMTIAICGIFDSHIYLQDMYDVDFNQTKYKEGRKILKVYGIQ